MAICRPCIGLAPCTDPSDLATGIDGALYSSLDFSFIVQCPTGCFCPPGVFPKTITILASTIPPVIPPITEPGSPIILRLQGCSALITRTLSAGSTQTQIAAAAQSMQAEWAGQQSICNALVIPGVNCAGTAPFVDVCNDAQNITCRGASTTVPANLYCQRLYTTGLDANQITAATDLLKASMNEQALEHICPFANVGCTIGVSFLVPGPGNGFQIFVTNFSGTKSFDPTNTITTHHRYGTNIILDQTCTGPVILPGQVNISLFGLGGTHGPISNELEIFYNGVQIFSYTQDWANYMQIAIGVNCGIP